MYSEFALLKDLLQSEKVSLAQDKFRPITSATAGRKFWNVCHTDADVGLTVLAACGEVSGGGEFVHPDVGVAHAIRPGCLLVVNPAIQHCTAEMKCEAGESGREMVAFFTKETVVKGAGAATAAARRLGRTLWGPKKKVRR